MFETVGRRLEAIEQITDREWSVLSYLKGDCDRHPQGITATEAWMLKLLAHICPGPVFFEMIQLLGGPEVRGKFDKHYSELP
jgi:hypothetical protein